MHRAVEQIKPETWPEAKNDRTETVLLWAHHEKAEFLGKDNNARKNRRQ